MSAIFNRYINNVDYTWYNSSNVIYSECYDKKDDYKDLKIVFKGGRSYLYENLNVNDYIMFRTALSQGKALNDYILVKDKNGKNKYNCVRLPDEDINALKNELDISIKKQEEIDKKFNSIYHIKLNPNTNYIELYMNDKLILSGINGEFNLLDVFKSIGISTTIENINYWNNMNDQRWNKH